MTRDEARKILGEGATEEQITNLLANFHNSSKTKDEEINNLKSQMAKFSDYDELKKKLDDIEKANMSEQEKLEQMRKETETNLRNSRIIVNKAKAKEILAEENFDDDIINSLVTDDLDVTIALATKMKNYIGTMRENTVKKTQENLVNLDLKPNTNDAKPTGDAMTIDKFNDLSAEEQNKFIAEHPEEFNNLF